MSQLFEAAKEQGELVGKHFVGMTSALVTTVIDLLFLAAIIGLNRAMALYVFDPLKDPDEITLLLVQVLQWAFLITTLIAVLSQLVRDAIAIAYAPWRPGR